MKRKKFTMYVSVIILLLFIIFIGFLILKNKKNKNNLNINEFIPEEEISDEQMRKTNIELYFENLETGELAVEIRQIDSKILLENPEKELIEYLIQGPQNNNFKKLIPNETKLINAEIEKGILNINFSEEFIKEENLGEKKEQLIIKSIIKTVSQLNEINSVKILINNEEGKCFSDGEVKFLENFIVN